MHIALFHHFQIKILLFLNRKVNREESRIEEKKKVEKVFSKKIETGGNGMQRKMQVHTAKLEDLGLIEILKWCMVSDCLFRANR